LIKYRLFKTNTFKRSYKKKRLSDEEELAYIDVIYMIEDETLKLVDIGSHSELFN